MRQRQIIKEIAEKFKQPQNKTKQIIDSCLEQIKNSLVELNTVEIPNFGVFNLQKIKQKNASIPGKKGTVVIPEHYKLQFKVSENLKKQIQGLEK